MLNKIKKYFNTNQVKLINQNMYHKNKNQKKHLMVLIISNKFININILERHKQVYKILNSEMNKINSLSIYTYTLQEWKNNDHYKIKNIACYNKKIL